MTKKQWTIFIGVLVIAAIVPSIGLGRWGFWFDESFTSELISFGYGDVIFRTSLDVHPPLYYLVLKFWSNIVGVGDIALRSLSIVLNTLGIGILYFLIKKLFDAKAALWAALFASIGPFAVRYAQEARMYSLSSLILLILTYIYLKVTEAKTQKQQRAYNAAYALLLALALYTHYFAVLIVATHFVHAAIAKLDSNKKRSIVARLLEPEQLKRTVGAFVLYIPWLPTLFRQFTSVNSGFWIRDVSIWSVPELLSQFLGFSGEYREVVLVLLGILLAFVVYTIFRSRTPVLARIRKLDSRVLSGMLLVGPLILGSILLVIYSAFPFTSSVYTERYLSQFSLLFYGGVGVGLRCLYRKYKYPGAFVSLALIVLMVSGIVRIHSGSGGAFGDGRPNERAKQAVEVIEQEGVDNAVVITDDYWNYYNFDHYLGDQVFVQPEANIDTGGAVLLRDRSDEVQYSLEQPAITSADTLYYVHFSEEAWTPSNDSWDYEDTVFVSEGSFVVDRYERQ